MCGRAQRLLFLVNNIPGLHDEEFGPSRVPLEFSREGGGHGTEPDNLMYPIEAEKDDTFIESHRGGLSLRGLRYSRVVVAGRKDCHVYPGVQLHVCRDSPGPLRQTRLGTSAPRWGVRVRYQDSYPFFHAIPVPYDTLSKGGF